MWSSVTGIRTFGFIEPCCQNNQITINTVTQPNINILYIAIAGINFIDC